MEKITGWVKCPTCDGRGLVDTLVFGDGSQVYGEAKIQRFNMYEFKFGREASAEEYCPSCKGSEVAGCLPIYEEQKAEKTASIEDLKAMSKFMVEGGGNTSWFYSGVIDQFIEKLEEKK